jgi:phosphopantetheine binding protein
MGQIRGLALILPGVRDDNRSMAVVDSVHARLADLLASMMGAVCGRPAPRAHLSFLALGGDEPEAGELAQTVNAVFGLSLTAETIMRSPTPDALARTIESSWGASAADLLELVEALAEAD